MKRLACLLAAVLALSACGGGSSSKEAECSKLGDQLVKLYDDVGAGKRDPDAAASSAIDISNHMDKIGCPSPSS